MPEPAFPIRALLRWYADHGRDLPWRVRGRPHPDPYRVLVSEAMLQQTQVATATPYYHRFLERFPTVAVLAAADEQDVLAAWQGLGYYRRARHLHAAARVVVEQHAGALPATYEALRELPGVGDYTAGAIASIAFGVAAPVVDGNVLRVMARFEGMGAPVDKPTTVKRVRARCAALVQAVQDHPVAAGDRADTAGDFNQALMELGATVCTPASPRCLDCPLRDECVALRTGRVAELPVKQGKKPPTTVTHTVVVLRRGGKRLVAQRPDSGLWAGMWEFPTLEDEIAKAAGLAEQLGLQTTALSELARFTHPTTHRTITFVVLTANVTAGRLRRDDRSPRWATADAIAALPMSNPQRRIAGLTG